MRLSVNIKFIDTKSDGEWVPDYLIKSGFDWRGDTGFWVRDIQDSTAALNWVKVLVERGLRVEVSES